MGAGIPLLAGAFIDKATWRIMSVVRFKHPTGHCAFRSHSDLHSRKARYKTPLTLASAPYHHNCQAICSLLPSMPLVLSACSAGAGQSRSMLL